MSFHWINPADISINCILLMDRRLVGQVCGPWYGEEYSKSLAIVLTNHPAVAWYCK